MILLLTGYELISHQDIVHCQLELFVVTNCKFLLSNTNKLYKPASDFRVDKSEYPH